MKIVGLITEYNPFHKGHEFHIAESLRITKADRAIVIMSGDFVQRGTPAIIPKHLRTEMALKGGASMVIELPVRFATGSAETFATNAIELLDSLGCVDSICFGSECGNITALSKVADVLADEPSEYKQLLQEQLRNGVSYPKAREIALLEYGRDGILDGAILSEPNNILGVEYLKALKSLNSSLTPYTITRNTSQYHDVELGSINSSATAIREVLLSRSTFTHLKDKTASCNCSHSNTGHYISSDNTIDCANFPEQYKLLTEMIKYWDNLHPHVTDETLEIMKSKYGVRLPVVADDFSLLLWNKLLQLSLEELCDYVDITEELARRIYNLRHEYQSFTQFTELVKTKNYTYSRISRCLLHILLDIKKNITSPYESSLETVTPINDIRDINGLGSFDSSVKQMIHNHYIHVLGFKKEDKDLLTLITNESKLPLLTKLKDMDGLSTAGVEMITQDIAASNLYEMVVAHKFGTPYIPELSKSMIMI